MALKYFAQHGLPSGGSFNSSEGCQPYSILTPCSHHTKNSPYKDCTPPKTYPKCSSSCTNNLYKKTINKDYRFANPEYQLPAEEEAIMKDLIAHGPLVVAFQVHEDFFAYKSGVYEAAADSKNVGGHAVKLVGWGVEKKVPYWLIMNSWNEYWGDKGLIKMKRNSPINRIEVRAYGATAKVKKIEADDF